MLLACLLWSVDALVSDRYLPPPSRFLKKDALFETLGERYGADKLAILAFPSQEFGGQEFGTDEEIQAFAASKNFPSSNGGYLMKLGSVKGDTAPEIWKHMRDATGSSDPGWNFDSAYLVSKSGVVSVPKNLEEDIESLMAE